MAGEQAKPRRRRKAASKPKIKVVQVRSGAGRLKKHQACLVGLGLRRIGQQVELEDTPAVRGMIARIPHLVNVIGESTCD